MYYFYRLQTKWWEGNFLTCVCHSVQGRGEKGNAIPTLLWADQIGNDIMSPGTTKAGGTHPTGMHSCVNSWFGFDCSFLSSCGWWICRHFHVVGTWWISASFYLQVTILNYCWLTTIDTMLISNVCDFVWVSIYVVFVTFDAKKIRWYSFDRSPRQLKSCAPMLHTQRLIQLATCIPIAADLWMTPLSRVVVKDPIENWMESFASDVLYCILWTCF